MSDQEQTPQITDEMKRLLQEVQKYAFPPKELTFYSIVGSMVGIYENPTSDLLRFFMSQEEGHDLGAPFLRAFFACLGKKDCSDLSFENVKVRREVETRDGKFIDLHILGPDWVLLIENKIDHWPANPFDSYEEHAKHCYPLKKHYFAILSPEGKPVEKWPNWQPVSYHDYCRALKSELFDRPLSKWQVFAREFIVHIENLLYDPTMKMNPDQTDFVEKNLREIADVRKLHDCYVTELCGELAGRVQDEFSGNHEFPFVDKVWALECAARIGDVKLQLRLLTPAVGREDGNSERKYKIQAYVERLTEDQHQRATHSLTKYGEPDGRGHWWGHSHFEHRADAVNGLCKLAKELFDLLENKVSVSAPIQASV